MSTERSSARAVWALRDFRLFCALGFITAMIQQSQAVAVGWDIYERTGSALALGWVGLAQFIPTLLAFLPAGQLADRHDRRFVMIAGQLALAAASAGLAFSAYAGTGAGPIYVFLALMGIAQAFNRPARDALLPQLMPPALLANAIALNSSIFQVAWMGGPAFAGVVIAATGSATTVYTLNLLLAVLAIALALAIAPQPAQASERPAPTLGELFAGVNHVWHTRLVLGVLSVDLLAVLFGGVSALLPIFAKDVLGVGPTGLGWLSSAQAMGAFLMGLAQSLWKHPGSHAGRAFLFAVAGYGAAMAVFGLSQWFWLSFLALLAAGALDNISVVLRQTTLQLNTPDALRGRVSAVNRVFVDASSQLGGLRSGVVTALTSPVVTVVAGGLMTAGVVLAAAKLFPEIRRLERLGAPRDGKTG
ncbi:MAG: MFS transporter [Burkholderiales bacterium]|nr:MFS transporter [Burkholderiales bacterium]